MWVLIFGLLYGLVGIVPCTITSVLIVPLGGVLKLLVVLKWAHMYTKGTATSFALLAGIGDSVFALLFFAYFFNQHKIFKS